MTLAGAISIESSGSKNLKVTYGSTSPQTTTSEFPNTEQITIISTSTAGNKVIVKDGVTAKITLNNVDISNDVSPFQLLGTAEVELNLSGTNTLTCTNTSYNTGTYAGLYVSPSAAITIAAETGTTSNSLTAKGGVYGAGIVGSYVSLTSANNAAGSITINSGNIIAQGGNNGAGIGGSYLGAGGSFRQGRQLWRGNRQRL